ncbi:helix-turn-helix domain-containing protein [Saccharopolyspora sp. HNM0983]|uniref:Helix-turn-helix domain-containing protein n=1 Tax=Saccharopolyspora montiporae TaxID=2781240 RepID=A0A929BA01_9PSEU|nr:helix-turn-helix domain-containing protein [Saccharopolyspora sp. HNM0983]MBE9376009.1 helix-turn-helix domain-containing protein [Saccharopolyspora sp. HNM0983]
MTAANGLRAGGTRRPPSVVERMTLILDVFPGRTSWLTLAEVTRDSGLPRSTVFRILVQLVELDWIEHGAPGYRLGTRAHGLSTGTAVGAAG